MSSIPPTGPPVPPAPITDSSPTPVPPSPTAAAETSELEQVEVEVEQSKEEHREAEQEQVEAEKVTDQVLVAAEETQTAPNAPSPSSPATKRLQFVTPTATPASSAQQFIESPSARVTVALPSTSGSVTAPQPNTSNRRPSYSSPTRARRPPPTLQQTLRDLKSLLRTFLILLPSSLVKALRILIPSPLRRFSRFLLHKLAMVLHRRGALASSMFYDMMVFWWKSVITIFFREIRSRGAWKVPGDGEGAVIFVVGPHHNQFLDPLLLMSEVRREAGRRISFLVAAKSMDRKFIGQAAKLMQSIPVARAQDLAKSGSGHLTLSSGDDTTLLTGHGTSFLAQLSEPRCQIMLPRQFGNVSVEVAEVISDTEVKVKKAFPSKVLDGIRERGEKGVSFKILPHVDQTAMYSSVYQKLTEGGCIGIFPEGGSHDRTDLLPLKAGVSIMALGALSSNPSLRLRIVPVGLSYFHPHRFRSRAVVEFGTPIEVKREMVEKFEGGGEGKKEAISGVMELVVDGLKSVTVRAPDYETLMLIQATRRLYRPPGQHLTLGQIVELNKRFIAGYEVYKDEPRLIELTKRVREYNTLLRYMGLKDHQIEAVPRPLWRSILLLIYRLSLLSAWGILALPGVILNSPIFVAASWISRKKAKEALAASTVKIKGNDVLATWKVLVALAGAPTLYTIYAIGATVLAHKMGLPFKYQCWAPVATMAGLPVIGYSALKFGEVGMDVYKSLRPLFLSVLPGNEKQLDKLRTMRASLQFEINQLVEELAPAIFDDFHSTRIVPPSSRPPPGQQRESGARRSTYGPQGQGTFFTHPMSWVDEYLFGWSQSVAPKTPGSYSAIGAGGAESDGAETDFEHLPSGARSGYVSGYTTEEPDYDEVINILSREQGLPTASSSSPADQLPLDPASSETLRYRRNSSRSRSRSQLDLTALNAAVKGEASASASAVEEKEARGRKAAGKADSEER